VKHQRDIRKFPTEKSPDLENENPGAVGTATGAEVHKFLEEPNEIHRKRNVDVKAAAALRAERSSAECGAAP